MLCIQTFTKSLGWHVLALNNHIGVGDLEPVGNAVGAIIASPFHDKFVNFLLRFQQYHLLVVLELADGLPEIYNKEHLEASGMVICTG